MITSVSKILKLVNLIAPFESADSWDNVGLIIGNPSKQTTRILLALDLSDEVLEEAIEEDIDLIITHHPPIFSPIKQVTTDTKIGQKIINCIENGISVIAAHTNLDRSFENGINRYLADSLSLSGLSLLNSEDGASGYGIVGNLDEPMPVDQFMTKLKVAFDIPFLKTTHYKDDAMIKRVAISSGASADFIEDALNASADLFILGDLKYHEAQKVEGEKLILVDVGHYESEAIYLNAFKEQLDLHIMSQGYDVMTMVSTMERPIFKTF